MKNRGFSLLEVLVTLIILGLLVSFLMQALVQVLSVRQKVLLHGEDARVTALQQAWFRESIRSALADLPSSRPAFEGARDTVRFVTASPLRLGASSVVIWRWVETDAGGGLEYVQDGEAYLALGPGLESLAITYRDSSGRWHDKWPVESLPQDVLPRAVRLVAEGRHVHWDWVVAIAAAPGLPPSLKVLDEPVNAAI